MLQNLREQRELVRRERESMRAEREELSRAKNNSISRLILDPELDLREQVAKLTSDFGKQMQLIEQQQI